MRFAIQRSITFCCLVLLMYAGSSVYFFALNNEGNAGHWTINVSYYALEGGILVGGALVGVFVALRFSRPKRPPSVFGMVILAVLYFFFASLLLGLIWRKAGPYFSVLAAAVFAYLLIRYPGRASLEPVYRRLEGHPRILKPLAFIGVPLSLAILDFSARGLTGKWPEPVLALTAWGLLVALCLGIGSISIAILVSSSRARRVFARLSYVGGMLTVALLAANPGFFLTERYEASEHSPRFFPQAAENDRAGPLKAYWYAKFLTGLREDPLCCNPSGSAETYRFTWLRSFHHPVVIRLEQDLKGGWILHTKVSSGAGGYEPGILGLDLSKSLSLASARHLRESMSVNSAFWDTPNGDPSYGFDGAQWILESKIGGEYHFADRWSPQAGLVHDIGLQFLAMSGADFGAVY